MISNPIHTEEPIRSVCTPSTANLVILPCSLISRAQENMTVHGMSSSRPKAGFYTVLPNTVNLNTFFVSYSSFTNLTTTLTASFVDVYNVTETSLVHLQSISILPSESDPSNYRGDTLRLRPPSPICDYSRLRHLTQRVPRRILHPANRTTQHPRIENREMADPYLGR